MPYKDIEKRRANGRAAAKRYREKYPERARAATKKWETANPDKVRANGDRQRAKDPEYQRRYWYMTQYGITLEQRDQILAEFDGKCAICRDRPAEHIDHDGVSGKIRGALCGSCNRAIGLLLDNPDFARSAALYLERDLKWEFA